MKRKTATIKLSFWKGLNSDPDQWLTETVGDSTEYSPGLYLNKRQVDALCDNPRWKVTIGPPQG